MDATAIKVKIESLVLDQVRDKESQMESKGINIANIQSKNYKSQRIYIYFNNKPTSDEISDLNDIGVSLDVDHWIPPVGSHPYGFVPAALTVKFLYNVAELDYIVKILLAERPYIPMDGAHTHRLPVEQIEMVAGDE